MSEHIVTLSWSDRLQTEVSDLQPDTLSPAPPADVPAEDPPGYATAQTPTRTLQYSFSQLGFNSMIVVPPATAQDTRPQYYINTSMNVFMPLSFFTSVYRGANEYGELVGEFEMGVISTPPKLQMKSMKCSVNSVLSKVSGGRSDGIWTWAPTGDEAKFKFQWTYMSVGETAKCRALGPGKRDCHLASFIYPNKTSYELYNHSKLEVTPEGQEYFDHILMSLMLIERRRLTPGTTHLKDLFNYTSYSGHK